MVFSFALATFQYLELEQNHCSCVQAYTFKSPVGKVHQQLYKYQVMASFSPLMMFYLSEYNTSFKNEYSVTFFLVISGFVESLTVMQTLGFLDHPMCSGHAKN